LSSTPARSNVPGCDQATPLATGPISPAPGPSDYGTIQSHPERRGGRHGKASRALWSAAGIPVIHRRTVEEFVSVHLRSLRGSDIHHLAVGDFSTWLVGNSVIVRFALNPNGDGQLRREAAALRVVGPGLNVSVPEIEVLAESGAGHLAVAYPVVPGISGEDRRPEGGALVATIDVVAECLRRLHAIDPSLVEADLPRPKLDYEARLSAVVARAGTVFRDAPESITRTMRSYLDGSVTIPAETSDRALCHTDLKGEHFLLDPETEVVTGVIDWADVAVDDPAVDIGSLAIWLGEGFSRSVAASYGAAPAVVDRGLFRIRTWILTGFAKMLSGENSWPPELVRRQVEFAFAE
jgi:aminoglycoside phosphotransferase